MKIYRITYQTEDGVFQRWAGSKEQAKHIIKDLSSMLVLHRTEDTPEVEAVDFPTTRKAIISWLDTRFTSLNG
jgi:hypothetical protein